MSNEIQYRHDQTGETLYVAIVNADPDGASYGKYWNAVVEALETLSAGDWADYAVGLAETPEGAYRYVGDFPDLPPGTYSVLVFVRGGAAASIADLLAAESQVYWDGAAIAANVLGVDVDSTGSPLSARKALEALVAVLAGNSTFDEATGLSTFLGRDGQTPIVTNTTANVGTRTGSSIS